MLLSLTLSVLIFLFATRITIGQDAFFSQFYANPLYLNPAFAGTHACTRLSLGYRNQPYPDFGSFATYSFAGDTYQKSVSGGIGFSFFHDHQGGLLSNTAAGLYYAWHSPVSRNWDMALGMQVSYANYRIHQESLIFPDQFNYTGDISLTGNETFNQALSSHYADFAAGFLFFNNNFFAGGAVHHLTQPIIDFHDDHKIAAKYNIMAGYTYTPYERRNREGETLSFSPNFIFQSQSGIMIYNFGLYARHDQITAGIWFRHNDIHPNTLIFTFGLKQVNYAIGYSYDYSLSGFSTAFGGAHELSVLLNFNCPGPNERHRILNCPTF